MHHGQAIFAGVHARTVVDYADLRTQPQALGRGGWWAVAAHFDGPWHAWRFADIQYNTEHRGAYSAAAAPEGTWHGPDRDSWRSSMSRQEYVHAVQHVRGQIEDGRVYQANICRVLSAPVLQRPPAVALHHVLAAGNPARYAGVIDVPDGVRTEGGRPAAATWVVSASPELGLAVRAGQVTSGPIKGTAIRPEALGAKDRAENLMITDLVRNDLQRVCRPGTVAVTDLLKTERHPGLVHLVSTVRGELRWPDLAAADGAGWARVLEAMQPAGSISGAPKASALRLIGQLEQVPRGPYCGQIGWIDADAQTARLAVGIRTFWWAKGHLMFGTGAGITYDSDPEREWEETELKAARLVRLASS